MANEIVPLTEKVDLEGRLVSSEGGDWIAILAKAKVTSEHHASAAQMGFVPVFWPNGTFSFYNKTDYVKRVADGELVGVTRQ